MSATEPENKEPINFAILKRALQYARPFTWQIVFVLFTILLSTGLSMLPPLITRQLIDVALPQRSASQLNWLALAMVAIPVLNGLIGTWQRGLSAGIGEGIIRDLRQALYAHLQSMSLRFFTNTKTGEIMARLNSDVVGAQRAVTSTFISLITDSITLVVSLVVMFSLEWRLALLSIALFPLFILPSQRMSGILRDITRKAMGFNAQMSTHMNETLNVSAILLMKIFGRQAQLRQQFNQHSKNVAEIGVRSAVVGRWFFVTFSLISAIGTALVFWVGGHLVLQGTFTIGLIVAFASYLAQLYGPVTSLVNARVDLASSLVSFERVFEVLDLPQEIVEKPNAVALPQVAGRVQFANVGFRYDILPDSVAQALKGGNVLGLASQERGREGYAGGLGLSGKLPDYVPAGGRVQALQEIAFEIAPGQLVALVGPSGAGKTTLTYLLPRLYDPTSGKILLDGVDLRDFQLENLAQHIGMVTQETYLFHDTLRENLRYAKPSATSAEIEQACRVANIWELIESLPEGLDTVVGERGYRFSGGEKQRIAIARVVLKDPRILVLDEATASLDSKSEALIQAALQPLFAGRTSIVIAHRLSTILAADKILVMEQGRLVEQGTHGELLANNGLYAELYHTQFRQQTEPSEPQVRND